MGSELVGRRPSPQRTPGVPPILRTMVRLYGGRSSARLFITRCVREDAVSVELLTPVGFGGKSGAVSQTGKIAEVHPQRDAQGYMAHHPEKMDPVAYTISDFVWRIPDISSRGQSAMRLVDTPAAGVK